MKSEKWKMHIGRFLKYNRTFQSAILNGNSLNTARLKFKEVVQGES
jgi:hypothetical protein